jgi:hypothetical protein
MSRFCQQESFVELTSDVVLQASRRRFLRQSAIALAIAAGGLPLYAADEPASKQTDQQTTESEAVDLTVDATNDRPQQVKVAVETAGQMKMNPDGKEVKYLPLSVTAELNFVQRRLPTIEKSSAVRIARHHSAAEAKYNLKNTEFKQALRDDRRLLVVQSEGDAATIFSPLGPLSREELELVDVPGTAVLPELLLPGKSLKPGETWNLPDPAVVRLLSLEAVHKHDVVGKFDEMRDGIAILSLEGKVSGAVGGVSSESALRAKLNFDPKLRMLTWLAISLNENRAIGHAQPGYDVTSRIRILTTPAKEAAELSENSLSGLPLVAKAGESLLAFRSDKGGFELVHDRRWRVMTERYDSAILRMIDRGDLIAQCNVAKLKDFGKDEKLTLEAFQADVKQALEKQKAQINEASESTSDAGMKVLRLQVLGFTAELPIQWTYYHLSDSAGRRASIVFTIDQKLVANYAHIDQEIISGFQFFQPVRDEASEPTPADKPKGETAQKPDPKSSR